MMMWLKLCVAGAAMAVAPPMASVAAAQSDGGMRLVVTVQPGPAVLRFIEPAPAAAGDRSRYRARRATPPYAGYRRPWNGSRFDDRRHWRGEPWTLPYAYSGRSHGRPAPYAYADHERPRYGAAPRGYDGTAQWRRDVWAWRPDGRSY